MGRKDDAAQPAASSAAPVAATTAAPPAAKVSIGSNAAAAEAASGKLADSVAARLEQVRAQLEAGTYAIDYERLAAALADDFRGVPQ